MRGTLPPRSDKTLGTTAGPVEKRRRAFSPLPRATPRHNEPVDRAPLPRRRLLTLATGTALAVVVWVLLVVAAVRLVGAASDRGVGGWLLVVLVSAGAAAALFVGLLLGVRLVAVVRRREPAPAPPRPKGGKRAAR